MIAFLTALLPKALIAKIAINVAERVVQSTDNPYDDMLVDAVKKVLK